MANTIWNPSDKSAQITLSGSNLIATSTGAGLFSVRAVDKQLTGKFYWENTCNTITSGNTGVGIHTPSFSFVSGGYNTGGAAGICGVVQTGLVYLDGGHGTLPALGTLTAGTVVCIAVDCVARLIWYRIGAAGNWNASAAANPATGVGGVAFTTLGGGIPIYPSACFGANGDQITANFGDSVFTGAVPAGFTSGFTAGASVPTNALATQAAVEQWATATDVPAQVTQVALEEWATVSAGSNLALVTQVAIEEWASSFAPMIARQNAITVISG